MVIFADYSSLNKETNLSVLLQRNKGAKRLIQLTVLCTGQWQIVCKEFLHNTAPILKTNSTTKIHAETVCRSFTEFTRIHTEVGLQAFHTLTAEIIAIPK